jgi:small subunit ribosomal protein S10
MEKKSGNKGRKITKITIYGYDVVTIEEATKQIFEQLKQMNLSFSGPTPLPTKKKVVTVPISPHKHKDSQEQFIREIHRRMIFITSAMTKEDVVSLSKLRTPNTANLVLRTSF